MYEYDFVSFQIYCQCIRCTINVRKTTYGLTTKIKLYFKNKNKSHLHTIYLDMEIGFLSNRIHLQEQIKTKFKLLYQHKLTMTSNFYSESCRILK